MLNNQKKNIITVGIHVLVWSLLFLFPYLMFPDVNGAHHKAYLLAPLLFYVIIFYLNYSLLVPIFLLKKKVLLYSLFNFILILICIYLSWQSRQLFMKLEMPTMNSSLNLGQFQNRMPKPPMNLFLIKDFFSYGIPVIFSIAIRTTQRWIKSESEKKEIENRNLESEISLLNYQIQPHFFFNSLNNIYSQIEVSPLQAQESIHALSKLMRYLLYEAKTEKVDLSNEIAFLKKYIQLMELRQSNKTKTNFSFPELTANQYSISPFLMIPLIENAFKHGVSATKASQIYFSISIFENELSFVSGNSNFPKNESDISGSGIGIENLRKRLELIYPNRHDLQLKVVDDMFWVTLKIKM